MYEKMKILLIEPPFYMLQGIQAWNASLGLAMLAAMANREGFETKVFSPDLEYNTKGKSESVITEYKNVDEKILLVKKRLDEILSSYQPEIIGVSLWTARANVGLELAAHAKDNNPHLTIIAGGIHPTILPKQVLNSKGIDYVIRGEGEFAFIALLKALKEKRTPTREYISGLSCIDDHGNDIHNEIVYCKKLDDLPFPGYEHFLNYKNFDPISFGSVMFSRGCPFKCTYCASHMLWTRRTRYHSPEYGFAALKHIYENFGTNWFRFDDDTFTLKKNLVKGICKYLQEEKLPIKWHCDTRVELVTYDLLQEMKDVGLETIAMGVESGDPEMRKIIRKTSSLEEIKRAFNIASEIGIRTVGYFMIGFPGETFQQAERTLDLIMELKPTIPCISICVPYPGTETFDKAVELGLINNINSIDWSMYYHHSNMNFSGMISDKDWNILLKRCAKIEEQLRLKRNLEDLTVGKLINRYIIKPQTIFKDVYKISNIIWKRFTNT